MSAESRIAHLARMRNTMLQHRPCSHMTRNRAGGEDETDDAAREARVSSDQNCGVYLAFFEIGDSLKYGVHISTMCGRGDPT